ncbi:unnamed protein product [Toxocara canis]|uniref:Midasin n=1 Tax=Toxocara canis TaxID=6265 RepID=A0A183ULV1_TOXCA|nr:unnamed protein product [Toxocara canis]
MVLDRLLRNLNFSDLFRAFERLQHVTDLTDNVAVFGELSDVWALHCVRRDDVMQLSQIISDHLSVNRDQLNYYLNLRLPTISLEQENFVCGRATLRIAERMDSKKYFFIYCDILNKHPLMGVTRDICQLMERVAVCITRDEPVLLVGETGVGKTSVVQSIAAHANVTLRVVNLSQHSDSSDLIGGYKPVSLSTMLEPLKSAYDKIFLECFDAERNANFLSKCEKCLKAGRYVDYATIICEIARKAIAISSKAEWHVRWADILVRAERFKQAVLKSALPFAYVRGVVARAAEHGDWLLVDEINLAPSECLDAIVHVLDDMSSRHSNFRLFACMNPATDTGKRNLPDGVRTRFTEIFVGETTEIEQLSIIGRAYLPAFDARRLNSVLELYRTLCEMLPGKYSLRTLCRALSLTSANLFGGEIRSLCESISLAFLSDLDAENRAKVEKMIVKYVGKVPGNPIPKPSSNEHDYINVEGYWVEVGTEQPLEDPQYIRTASVKRHLADLARIVCSGRYPILLEGETSAGKTAMVTHLARVTGNLVVRINNHEHTDLQEYIGSYAPDISGKLAFVEGALLKAVRAGHWVILDELNLAPTDVIEALNRLLDDNRELFVPELNAAVKAHSSFRLFATQNPVSTYAGRKRLSRALVSRFVVLRFDHLPFDELAQMVVARCAVAPSSANKMVSVLCDLRAQRSLMGVFSARDGLMTLRDVFRWAKRLAISEQTDWQQCLADQGFFLLAARCRTSADEDLVKRTLEKHLKRSIDPERLFAIDSPYMPESIRHEELRDGDVVLTSAMCRMIVLCTQAWLCDEPVLMVGETGCGKTTVAGIIAKEKLLSMNCHERTETSDFLGSLRPVGDGTFCWMDGIVVQAMKEGRPLLIDEISLAADSVLERLNPLFEPSRTLLLTDVGTVAEEVKAKSGFNVIATMNPGGDYGKKELSKALRNRFTECWCLSEFSAEDMKSIVLRRMRIWTPPKKMPTKDQIAECMVRFVVWFSSSYSHIFRCGISIRDIVAATQLFISCMKHTHSVTRALYHAFSATVFDALGAMPARVPFDRLDLINDSIRELNRIAREEIGQGTEEEIGISLPITVDTSSGDALLVSDFVVPFGPLRPSLPAGFTFEAPTCKANIYKIARALSIDKPILIEGAPGCGKSSTVVALAAATGHPLTRLNLSDQTDLSDLFGSDIPVVLADGSASFAWKDGPVLSAIKSGHWILLDEMNLASQSVLEGLNSCLDHRRQLFIAELNRCFEIGSGSRRSRFFACQNPQRQGGNRRALPKSFVNRFTSIYAEDLKAEDERIIVRNCYSAELHDEVISQMVDVKEAVVDKMATDPDFAIKGAPFEFNLRDLLRWAELSIKSKDIAYAFDLIFVKRLRSSEDREKMRAIFRERFGYECIDPIASISISHCCVRIGKVELPRVNTSISSQRYLVSSQLSLLEQLAVCVRMNWLTLLVGKANIGKTSAVKILADLTGNTLHTMRLTSETDALELLGSFEQVTDYVDMEEVKNNCARLLAAHEECRDAVLRSEDMLALRLAIQSAAYLLDEETAKQLRVYVELLNRNRMRFQWVNSCFLEAFANGYWILIENVNCCSAAVLDRLNTCLELNGELFLSECGDSRHPIKAHPGFRVFFTMDEANGSISRAMRNRSIEIFVLAEDNAWYHRISDVVSIVSPKNCDEELICTLSTALGDGVRFSSEQLLQLKVLVRGIPLAQVLKIMNGKSDDIMEVDGEYKRHFTLRYPLINAELLITLDEWKCAIWRWADDEDLLMGAMWCLLSGSLRRLASGNLQNIFPECHDLLSGAVGLVKSSGFVDEYLPFDERFEGPLALRVEDRMKDYTFENSVILRALSVWIWAQLKATKTVKGSVIHLSTALMNKKITLDELPSECIRYIRGFMDELFHLFPNLYCNLQCSLSLLLESAWDMLLFVRSASEKLAERTGCAPAHVAWQRMSNTFAALPFSSANLKHLIDCISEAWSTVDEEGLSRFLTFYKEQRIVEPFKDRENWLQVSKFIEAIGRGSSEAHLSPNIMDGYEQEQDTEDERGQAVLGESAFDGALKMINDIFGSFALLKRNNSQQALRDVCGRMTRRPIALQQTGAFKWIDEKWGNLAHWLTFLSDDFAVNEFPLAFKNIDLAKIPLGAEVMQNVWRALQFDASLRAVTLKEFGEFTSQRDRFCFLLWKLAPHLGDFNDVVRRRLADVLCHLKALVGDNEMSNDGHSDGSTSLLSLIKQLQPVGLALMRCATPVDNMVDPVISDEYNYLFLKSKVGLFLLDAKIGDYRLHLPVSHYLRMLKMISNNCKTFICSQLDLISAQLAILQRYQSVVSGQQSLSLYQNSKHPLIASLVSSYFKISDEMTTYNKESQAFRPSYNDYAHISLEMRSFLQMTSEWCGNVLVEFNGWENRSTEQLEVKRAQLESFLVSASAFSNRMISRYSAYADVMQSFVLGVRAVMLCVSYVRSEIAVVLSRRRLMYNYSIPPSSTFELNELKVGNEQLLNWCLSEKSIMPKRLQLCVVYSFIRQRNDTMKTLLCTTWIEREWSKWYARHAEKEEKSFVYRKSCKTSDPVDEDDSEMAEIFPDYSSEWEQDSEMCANDEAKGSHEDLLGDEDLANLLREFLHTGEQDRCNTYMPIMWLIDATAGGIPVGNDVDSALTGSFFFHTCRAQFAPDPDMASIVEPGAEIVISVSHLMALKNLGTEGSRRVVDVYKTNCPSELMRCVEALGKLNERLKALKEKWPEMTVLNDILQVNCFEVAFSFICEAEHWEKVADRKHSISGELLTLREMLVDWRKMEVLCWSDLLQSVQRVCGVEAFLIAWPLFEAIKNNERQSEEILAMSIEWIQRSTLLDFEARLESTRLLAKYALLTSRPDRELMEKRILSIAAYFAQYSKVVATKFEALKSPVENQLREFVKVVKYNDLNLWSVKLSAQKAHQQLFRIVKQFKASFVSDFGCSGYSRGVLQDTLCGNEPIAPLIDTLLPIADIGDCEEVLWKEEEGGSCDEVRIRKAARIAREIAEKLHSAFSIETLNEMLELVVDCDQLIRKEVVYEGEDEEKEKQQGRALAERQKVAMLSIAISLLLKRSAEFGLRFRKGLTVDAELMTTTSVTGIIDKDCLLSKLVRQSAASRSSTLKCLHKPNEQLSSQTISRLKGITEFVLKELLQFNDDLSLRNADLHRIQLALRMLRVHDENIQNDGLGCIDHQQWYKSLRLCRSEVLENLQTIANCMRDKLNCAPRQQRIEHTEIYEMSGLADTALSGLYTGDAQYAAVEGMVERICSSIERLMKAVDDSLAYTDGCAEIVIWKRQDLHELSNLLHTEAESLCSGFVELSQWMREESAQGICLSERIIALSRISILDAEDDHSPEERSPSMEPLLLNLQYAYKRLSDIKEESEEQVKSGLDRVKWLANVAMGANLDKSANVLWALCCCLSQGNTLKADLQQAISLAISLLNVFGLLTSSIERFILKLALYYLHFESVTIQLLQKGYVNSIPKMEQQNEGETGKLIASDEAAGMGNAEGDRDVGNEMDNMGQIEGLKGENENESEKCEERKEDDKPIDMDDDFAANLEDVDREDADEGSEEEGEDEEPQVDETMGKVDESEENKLDPGLWDKDEEQTDEPNKELDQSNEGAREKTDQLTAKDDERDEQEWTEEEKGGDDHDGEDRDEEVENVDERETAEETPDDGMTAEQPNEKEGDEGEDEENEMGDLMEGKKVDEDEALDDEQREECVNDSEQQGGTEEKVNLIAYFPAEIPSSLEAQTQQGLLPSSAFRRLDNFMRRNIKLEDEAMRTTDGTNEEGDENGEENEAEQTMATHGGGNERNEEVEDQEGAAQADQNDTEVKDSKSNESKNNAGPKSDGTSEKAENNEDKNERMEGEEENKQEATHEKNLVDEMERMEAENIQEGDEQAPEDLNEENFAHIAEEGIDRRERLVVDKASVQEAKDSRTQLEELREQNKAKRIEQESGEEREDTMENEEEIDAEDVKKVANYGSLIHTSANLYQLADVSTMSSEMNNMQLRDSDELAESTAAAEERWSRISESLSVLSAELAENLRMIIEPTVASRLEYVTTFVVQL